MMSDAKNYFKGIQVPRDILFSDSSENMIQIHISQSQKNMQEDAAAFESWALILHDECKLNVEMTFQIPEQCKPLSSLTAYKNPKKQHFMRFLFRVWKFSNQMKWFSIGNETCRLCVQRFENLFLGTNTVNNIPLRKAGLREKHDPNDEHILENIFVKSKEAIKNIDLLTDSPNLNIPDNLFNQLPNGLFNKAVSKTNKIFPTGYFDLWGVNKNNNLCIFELKNKNNLKVGIISELYFYANFANEIFLTNRFNQKPSKHRGYNVLRGAVEKGVNKIHACFLAPEFHSEIRDRTTKLQSLLNSGEANIIYHFLTFNQEAIGTLSDCLSS